MVYANNSISFLNNQLLKKEVQIKNKFAGF